MKEEELDVMPLIIMLHDYAEKLEEYPIGSVLAGVGAMVAAISRLEECEQSAVAAAGLSETIKSVLDTSRFNKEIEEENQINDLLNNN